MTNKTHTPGPWETYHGDPTLVGRWDSPENFVAVADCDNQQRYPSEAVMRANARLIAAAPELLAVLRDIVDSAAGTDGGNCAWCGRVLPQIPICSDADCLGVKARAAIAKATGGAR